MTYSPWDGTTASTGDASYQLAFNSTASNGSGIPYLSLRKGIDSTWNSWYTLLNSGNYNSYAPTLTGAGASGTWGINITGNASTATNATTATNSTNWQSTSHNGTYWLNNAWDGARWYLTSNHGAPVRVGYADTAGNADTVDGYHMNQNVLTSSAPTFG
jgi:hypothetical protein